MSSINIRCPNEICHTLLAKDFSGTANLKCPKCQVVISVTTPAPKGLTFQKMVATV